MATPRARLGALLLGRELRQAQEQRRATDRVHDRKQRDIDEQEGVEDLRCPYGLRGQESRSVSLAGRAGWREAPFGPSVAGRQREKTMGVTGTRTTRTGSRLDHGQPPVGAVHPARRRYRDRHRAQMRHHLDPAHRRACWCSSPPTRCRSIASRPGSTAASRSRSRR